MKIYQKKIFNALSLIIAFFVIFFIFQKNAFQTVDSDFFKNFQKDSEVLVVNGIIANRAGLDSNGWGLGFIDNKNSETENKINDSYELFEKNKESYPRLQFHPYVSQYGEQGKIYAFLQDQFDFKSVSKLQYFPSAILALLVIAFHFLNRRVYGRRYAWAFTVSMVLSPWVASFARNLYWSPFLWLLPCFFSTLAYLTKRELVKCLCFALIFVSFFIKSLCGYEYISSITLLATTPFLLGPLFAIENKKPQIRNAILVFLICVAGFFSAFLIHASKRGNTVESGVVAIYKEDIKRRTYAAVSDFSPVYAESLSINPIKVVSNYVFKWSTPLLNGVPGVFFSFLLFATILGLYLRKKAHDKNYLRDVFFVLYMALIPLSWFVLAKAHSDLHYHINFVLWYLGFIPAILATSVDNLPIVYQSAKKFFEN